MGIRDWFKHRAAGDSTVVHSVVGGPLESRIGRPYDREALARSEYLRPEEIDETRAYPVPSLVGVVFTAPIEADLPATLEAILREHVCAYDWLVNPEIAGPLRKYGLLHTSIDAPIDERRDERMWLELVG